MLKVGVLGCAGRLGRQILSAVIDMNGFVVSGGTVRKTSEHAGLDLGRLAGRAEIGVQATTDPTAIFAASDIVIDFTSAGSTKSHAGCAASFHGVYLVGTTGMSHNDLKKLEKSAVGCRVVIAENTSIGASTLKDMARRCTHILRDWEVRVLDFHHSAKLDSPSGTALAVTEEIRRVADQCDTHRYKGIRPEAFADQCIVSLRAGTVVGTHYIIFAGPNERIEISHVVEDRRVFAIGAIELALAAMDKKPGVYSASDLMSAG